MAMATSTRTMITARPMPPPPPPPPPKKKKPPPPPPVRVPEPPPPDRLNEWPPPALATKEGTSRNMISRYDDAGEAGEMAVPQVAQNLASGSASVPHDGHLTGCGPRGWPQLAQNRA